MVRQLDIPDFPEAVEVIRTSCMTVAEDMGFTRENFPRFTGFVICRERLQTQYEWGWLMYGLYEAGRLAGYASISKEESGAYELHNLAVLPQYRHKGYGKCLLEECAVQAKSLGAAKLTIGIIHENAVLRSWYAANGFIRMKTQTFDNQPITVDFMELAL